MPIYEYQCDACRKRTTLLVLSISNPEPARCQHCGSERLTRLMSRIATPKSEDARLESLADPSSLGDLDESDPKSMARFMKKMAGEMGEDFDEGMMGEAEEGAGEEQSGGEGD
ncbi:MAG TPA: zinc ribbon domain-containing protein [Nitrospirales bacterium]|nr:zinc ribbon domain-containing protein [Nitrospirales bacterium]